MIRSTLPSGWPIPVKEREIENLDTHRSSGLDGSTIFVSGLTIFFVALTLGASSSESSNAAKKLFDYHGL